jgi:hypothetical protein
MSIAGPRWLRQVLAWLRAIGLVGLDHNVVILTMGALALSVGVLTYADRVAKGHEWPFLIIVGLIALVGLAAVMYRASRVFGLSRARENLADLLVEGRRLVRTGEAMTPELDREIRNWCDRVEGVLRKYLDEGYVLRFQVQGPRVGTPDPSLVQVWELQGRLQQIEEFLKELK